MNRRNLLTAAAWAAPAILFSTAAPARSTSHPQEPHICPQVTGDREDCGKYQRYTVRIRCDRAVTQVTINGSKAWKNRNGSWTTETRLRFKAAPVIIQHTDPGPVAPGHHSNPPTITAVKFN